MRIKQVVDTFPAFLTFWAGVQGQSLDAQIESWAADYLSPWPELLAAQVEDYASQGLDWRIIAREKVFPYLTERLPAMRQAHRNLLELCGPVYTRAQDALAFESEAVFVIHVGIGCGAGWARTYGDLPAVWFGLENIAECGWSDADAIAGLAAHEIGHLAHHHWRAQYGKPLGSGPWWQLYEEGFAQHCESLIRGTDAWHQMSGHQAGEWLDWCRRHRGWLAVEYLRTVDGGRPVSPFFGSWLNIRGKIQTGYYLGAEAIRALSNQLSLKEAALLDDLAAALRPVLQQMSEHEPGG